MRFANDKLRMTELRLSGRFRTNGMSLFELVGLGFVLILVTLMALNVGLLLFAAWLNDNACREATRAAAQQDSVEAAREAARLACQNFVTSAGSIINSPEVLLDKDHFEYETFPDEDGKPQLDKGPFVKVSTRLESRLPAPILFTASGLSNKISFAQTYTFPLIEPGTEDVDDSINENEASSDEDLSEQIQNDADRDGADEILNGLAPPPPL